MGSGKRHARIAPSTLVLPAELRARLEQLGRAAHPHEACGSIAGLREGARTIARELLPGRNLERERPRERYRLHPADQLAAEEHARSLGLEVVAYWHTHPDRPAAASESDRAAAQPGYSYLILSIGAGAPPELRAFRLVQGELVEEQLEH